MEETNEYRADPGEIKPELSMKGFLLQRAVTIPRATLEMFPCCAPGFLAHQLNPLRRHQKVSWQTTQPLWAEAKFLKLFL